MDILQAIEARHSVRAYEDRKIEAEAKNALDEEIAAINAESGLNIRLVTQEADAFGKSRLAHYGKFENVKNYLVLAGKKGDKNLQEKCGYYGERLVLLAQTLGLNTCWAALTFKKGEVKKTLEGGEKLALIIAVGYGKNAGRARKSKRYEDVAAAGESAPQWFKEGVRCALLAPTAVNQQKFKFILNGNRVAARAGAGFYTKVDLGIAKYHFEIGAGRENFEWQK